MKKTIAILLVAIMALTVLSTVDLVAAQRVGPNFVAGGGNRIGRGPNLVSIGRGPNFVNRGRFFPGPVIIHKPIIIHKIHRHIKILVCHKVWFRHHWVRVCRWVWVWR